jgi:FtsZ-binding cell division protein ZapB
MITLEQIRLLEERVRRAVDRISGLQEENRELRTKTAQYEKRVSELEARIDRFTTDQTQIEDGIKNALESLEGLEGLGNEVSPSPSGGSAPVTAPEPAEAREIASGAETEAEVEPDQSETDRSDTLAEPTDEANELDIF